MGLRIPQNQIVYKYTAGKEYMDASTYQEYQGYYYEFNGKTYIGKNYNTAAPELIKMKSDKVNTLLTNPATYLYGKISGKKITSPFQISSTQFFSYKQESQFVNRYFIQKINVFPIIIKEVNEETYKKLLSDPLYKTIVIVWNNYDSNENETALNNAEKQMPGIKLFLQDELNTGDAFGS